MKKVVLVLLVMVMCISFVSAKELETYERKSMFIFPVQYGDFDNELCSPERQEFVANKIDQMFVKEFQRLDFFNVETDQPFQTFLDDAEAYIRENARDIAANRMEADGKFKEAMVTLDDLLKTLDNSFALVPYVDDVQETVKTETVEEDGKEKEVVTGYSYKVFLSFELYNVKSGEKVRTVKVDNATSIMGMLMSGLGNLQNEAVKGLTELETERENQFRGCVSGLMTVAKKKMRSLPEFQIKAVASTVTASMIGFDMGKDTGIVMDQRYKAYTYDAEGKKKMTAFAKIRKIDQSYSEAQVLIGRSEEGDQILEDPKLGINIYAGMGFAPFKMEAGTAEFITGQHLAFLIGAEYNLAQFTSISEFYIAVNGRFYSPQFEDIESAPDFNEIWDMSVATIDAGIVKKFYLSRFAVTTGIYGTYSSVTWTEEEGLSAWEEISASSMGLTLRGGLEMLITPEFYAYGNVVLDMVGNPSKVDVDGEEMDFEDPFVGLDEFNASGGGIMFGVGFTF